ncbi:MAG: hypothetical protein COB77_00370 [Gammaproteobacteria bacterium]|nr:MAG: hypothetical protein COB77_00370 [Gammaproteobacteria bacterium]
MTHTAKLVCFFTLLACSNASFSGGPLVIQGAGGNTPVRYANPAITLHTENGDLGTLTNTQADDLIQEVVTLWNDITTSTIVLTVDTTMIADDIDATSANAIIQNNTDNLNPIIYDTDGTIIDDFFGIGASDDIAGFAASFFSVGGDFFSEGFAVINGKNVTNADVDLKLTIAHEIGHFIGLDHSQVNINNQENLSNFPLICFSTSASNYPLMYPFVCRDIVSLHLDDAMSLSSLYPSVDINNNLGILQGNLVNLTGDAILGANVFVTNNTTGETVSIVSDYLRQQTGFYKLYLPADNYTLHANSINTLFNGGSSIGPYANSILDTSFITPHPITETIYQDMATGNDAVITIATNQTLAFDFALDVGTNEEDNAGGSTDNKKSSSSKILGAPSFLTLFILLGLIKTTRRLYFSAL